MTDGTTYRAGGEILWESSPPSGPFIPFDGATTLRILHGLGVRPLRTDVEVAFSEYPERPGGGGSSDASGNQATKLLQDESQVVIKNDTCAQSFVRVTIRAASP